jgi:molybdopterin converting factor small subunit
MRIKALFHGILSDWLGVYQAEFNLPDSGNLGDLLSKNREAYGPNMPQQLWNKDQKAFNKAVWAMRGKEKMIDPTTKLKDGEEIKFFLTLAGG